MRFPILALSLVLSLISRGQAPSSIGDPAQGDATVKELAPAELLTLLGEPNVFIYDCNEEDMYGWAHVPGAVLTVYDAITAEKLPADKSATLVFYCYSPECPAGGNAAHTALTFGYTNVYSMTAGIVGWQDAGLRTEP